MPIYLMFIRVLLSVEFCFTLKTYLKGAPFYNASAWGKRSAVKCRPSRGFREAGFQIPNGIAAEMGRYRQECHGNLGQVLR
jgi:hypothetical protein